MHVCIILDLRKRADGLHHHLNIRYCKKAISVFMLNLSMLLHNIHFPALLNSPSFMLSTREIMYAFAKWHAYSYIFFISAHNITSLVKIHKAAICTWPLVSDKLKHWSTVEASDITMSWHFQFKSSMTICFNVSFFWAVFWYDNL
jgi:hypothetical protein